MNLNFSKSQLWPKVSCTRTKSLWGKFGWIILKQSGSCIMSRKVTGGSKSTPWNLSFNLIMWTNKYLVFLLGVPNFLFKTGLWKVSFRSTFYNAAARVLFFLFCVPREGGGTITSPLLTFAGTDCNVSGSFPISKHISSERHRESNSVYPCKTMLSYNTERWTSAIV